MNRLGFLALASLASVSGCGPSAPSTECKGMSWAQAVALARAQKPSMSSRSTAVQQDRFASDSPLAAGNHGYAAVVGFKGRDGRTLFALIHGDCHVEWSTR